jgi:hypothetical protein
MRFLNARLDVGNLDITGVGAVPAIGLRHSDVTQMRDTRITGSTGNTDVGLGFSSFSGASIIDGGASSWNTNNRATSNTITGSLGDIRIENSPTVATGQIITWAQAQSGVLDALANRIIGSTTGWPIRTDAVNGTILSGGTLTVPSLVGPGYAKTSAGGLFSVVSTIPYSDITGGPGGSVTSVGATLPLTSTGGASPTIALNYDNSTITLNGGNGIQVAAQTGDVTKPAGSNLTTLANIPNATPMAGSLLATAIAAPGTPAAGKGSVYVDSTSKNMCVKNDAGTVNHGAQTFTAALHQFATALSDAGAWSTAQPSYSDISGSVPAITSITGDGTASGPGAAALTLATVGTGVGSCTYCSVSFDAKGRETAYSSGTTPVLPTRAINTTSPLTGGGNMSADRTLGFLGPTSNRVYAGNGTGTDIIASDEIRIDDSTDQFMVSNDGMVTWRNLPGSGMISAVNYEQVKAKFVSNVWTLQSQKAGTGTTVRNMSIDATTADLLLAGNNINMSPLSGGGFVGADNSGNVQITTPTAEFNYYIEMSSGRISTLNTGDQYIATSSFDSIFGASPVLEYPTALTVASFARVEACLIGANPITSGEVDVCVEHNGTGGINLTFTSGSSGCQRTASTLIGGATDTVGVMLCQGTGIGGRHTATVTGTVRMTIKLRVSPYSTF